MAVYKRAYRPYQGPLTPERARAFVVARYALREVFESRVLISFLVLCFVPFLVEAAGIYVANSLPARALLRLPGEATPMNPAFFFAAMVVQGLLAAFLAAWVAPAVVAPDLANGALPLYLSRPLTRLEYVVGKAAVLVALLSAITWVPGLVLFALQAGLAGGTWTWANVRTPFATVAGSLVWITVLTLVALAVSVTIRWRVVASGAVVGVLFVGAAVGQVWAEVLGNSWGRIFNLTYLMGLVWQALLLPEDVSRTIRGARDLPTWAAVLGLAAAAAASAWLLHRRLRAREAVS